MVVFLNDHVVEFFTKSVTRDRLKNCLMFDRGAESDE